jgi:hypothetical protein
MYGAHGGKFGRVANKSEKIFAYAADHDSVFRVIVLSVNVFMPVVTVRVAALRRHTRHYVQPLQFAATVFTSLQFSDTQRPFAQIF